MRSKTVQFHIGKSPGSSSHRGPTASFPAHLDRLQRSGELQKDPATKRRRLTEAAAEKRWTLDMVKL